MLTLQQLSLLPPFKAILKLKRIPWLLVVFPLHSTTIIKEYTPLKVVPLKIELVPLSKDYAANT